jgi:hypothetical protein
MWVCRLYEVFLAVGVISTDWVGLLAKAVRLVGNTYLLIFLSSELPLLALEMEKRRSNLFNAEWTVLLGVV